MPRRNIELDTTTLQILFNHLWDGKEFAVRFPLFDVELFRYDVRGGRIASSVDQRTFESAIPLDIREKIRKARGGRRRTINLWDNLPAWEDFEQAMLSSGAVPYKNEGEVRSELRDLVRTSNRFDKHAHLGFDTNTLYHTVVRRKLPRWLPDHRAYQPAYVVSPFVEDEFQYHYAYEDGNERKLKDTQVKKLEEALRPHVGHRFNDDGGIAYALRQLRLQARARKACVGLGEIQVLKATYGATVFDRHDLPDGMADHGDPAIADSYASFQEANRNAHLVVLTSDGGMDTKLGRADVHALPLKQPSDLNRGIPEGPLDERHLANLVYDLTILFGVVEIPEIDTQIVGDYGAKFDIQGYVNENLRARLPEDREKLHDAIAQDLHASEAAMAAYHAHQP